MAAIQWVNIREQVFTGEEARSASDFEEIVEIHALSPKDAYDMFKDENFDIGKRLYFAEKIPIDDAVSLLFKDEDDRIRKVVQSRLAGIREEDTGGILIAK